MPVCLKRLAVLVLSSVIVVASGFSRADEPVKIRLATLAPKGSTYHRVLQEMAEKWRAAQGAGSKEFSAGVGTARVSVFLS